MPVFVHLTPARNLPAIRRSGVVRPPRRHGQRTTLFAVPVTPNFYITHQWLRELRRWHPRGPIAAVYFRLGDDEPVYVGRYNLPHLRTTAAHATALMWTRDPHATAPRLRTPPELCDRHTPDSREGFQIVLERNIRPREILRVKPLPQVIGWRYHPRAHGQPPFVCTCCCRGQRGKQTLLLRRAAAPDDGTLFVRNNAAFRRARGLARDREAVIHKYMK